jgi:hypothetical protein
MLTTKQKINFLNLKDSVVGVGYSLRSTKKENAVEEIKENIIYYAEQYENSILMYYERKREKDRVGTKEAVDFAMNIFTKLKSTIEIVSCFVPINEVNDWVQEGVDKAYEKVDKECHHKVNVRFF